MLKVLRQNRKVLPALSLAACILVGGGIFNGCSHVSSSSDTPEPAPAPFETPLVPVEQIEVETPSEALSYAFGSAASGDATAVTTAAAYDESAGYGFIFEGSGTVTENAVSSNKSFQFLAKVANANYRVTVITSATKVLSEVLPESFTYFVDSTGKTATYSCKDPTGIERAVTANTASTFDVAVCDGIMNLKFVLPDGAESVSVSSVAYEPIIAEARAKPYLIAIGDSTTENYESGKQCSWGPAISKNIVSLPSEIGGFINCARGGANSISIYNGGVRTGGPYKNSRFGVTEALLNVHPGDYVTINIGINNDGDSRAAQIPVFENYVVRGVLQRGGIPVIATITPRGDNSLLYTEDTTASDDTYAGGKLYKAGAIIPAGSWHNSRHDDTYNKNLLTIAANYVLPVIDLGMYGEQYLTDNSVTAGELITASDGYFSTASGAAPNHYAEKFAKVLANYVTQSIVGLINGTYENPYIDSKITVAASTGAVEASPALTVPGGFTEIYKNDYDAATSEDCGWNGFVNNHSVARGNASVTGGRVVLSGGGDGQKGVFFAPVAGGKNTLATVVDGNDFHVAFDINFSNANAGAITLVLSNAAGSGLNLSNNPQGGVTVPANCLLLLRQKDINSAEWTLFDDSTKTVNLPVTKWYTFAVTQISGSTHLCITNRATGVVVYDDDVVNPNAAKGGLGEMQIAAKVSNGSTCCSIDNVLIAEGSKNGKAALSTQTRTVTFDANGGEFSTPNPVQKITVSKPDDVGFTDEDFTKSLTKAKTLGVHRHSYDFVGWSADKNAGAATYTDGQSITVTQDMTLYAVWKYDDLTSLLNIADVNVGSLTSFSKQIEIDKQNAAVRDGIVNDDYDVDEPALQAKLDEFDEENDVKPYIIARAKTKEDHSQKWVLVYGAAAGNQSGAEISIPATYNETNSFDVINYALSLLPSNRSAKYKLLIDSDVYSGEPGDAKMSANSKIANLYSIEVPNYTIVDFNNHTLYVNNSDVGAIVPISMYSKHHVSLRNVTIDGPARYAVWAQGVDNAVFDTIKFNERKAGGVSLRIADRNINDWSTNVYVDNIEGVGCGNNLVETMKVDGIYVGKVTGTDCNDCALLLNTTTNAIVGTVRGTRCSPRSKDGVYAAFRCANYVGPNVHVHAVYADSCGRGFFSVSANHGITIDYLESIGSYKQAALIQDTQDLIIKSGKLEANGRNTGGPAIEFGKDSKGGPLTVMNNVIKNVTISGYSKSVSASKSDYTTLINCTCSGSVNFGGTDTMGLTGTHSKVVTNESELAINTTATEVTISGTTIADSAYRGWTALRSVTIPAGVTSIGAAAFMGCTSLEEVIIEGACTIGDNAFYGCPKLTTLTITGNVTEIGNCAFGGSAIESVVLPASVKKFGHTLFSPATTSVKVQSTTIETMGTHAFFNLGDDSTITFTGAKPGTDRLYHKDGGYAVFGDWGAFWYGKTRSKINQ